MVNGRKTPNEFKTDFKFAFTGGYKENWPFQVAEANEALAVVSDRLDHGCRAVFGKDMKTEQNLSYILKKESNEVTTLARIDNIWVIEAIVDIQEILVKISAGEEFVLFVRCATNTG